ncbi:transglutaminase family protein [Maribacter sp. PR1]|uniref:Transglutaminase family protein n=1 Tax=Maribacter cobaltidurans TaxID=1178778 RepID=A0ABU7IUQ9_9FLAO|nr:MULTISPECIES: transglutaminase family protein [Maribacter]MDC6389327.1 transglutaminase family protein [Maribacter sp. PR1]MEE1976715.1 transglutaminase family protein [Maribacter cobaltidurans]
MALKVAIRHKTKYKYDRRVNLSPHIFRLRPAPHSRTPIEAYSIKIKPENHFFNWQQDPFGNYLARIVFPDKTDELSVDVEIIADMKTINPFDFFVEESVEEFPFTYKPELKKELLPYLEITEEGPLLKEWLTTIDRTPRRSIDFLTGLNQDLYNYLNYTIRMEPGVQNCEETLDKKLGSCRDFAWLLVQTLRHLGLAARFVSGYLVQLKADEKSLDGPSGPEEDFTDLHAWAEVYLPGAGWIGLDATSGLLAGEGHIPLACTPSFESAAPVYGLTDPCETEFEFDNSVTRILESPRVTKPYTEEQWKAIYDLGFKVEDELQQNDVRLTMGGEPTFVSVDDMESEEWNTAADGDHKRQLASSLSLRLLETFGKGGMLHHAQGKWYPGEPLPRWLIGIHWRKDGEAIWKESKWLASFTKKYEMPKNITSIFLEKLSHYLKCSDESITPAYEDAFYFLWEEGKLPTDIDPQNYSDKDTALRKKLGEVLEQGVGKTVGHVLPLAKKSSQWITNTWEFRGKHLFLTPGNSPIGLRLPLESLPKDPEVPSEPTAEPELFETKPELKPYASDLQERMEGVHTNKEIEKQPFVRTAICAEVREEKLFLFLPPLDSAEDFLDLVSSIEATAKDLEVPVILEGYEPPRDNRLEVLKVTPDPGVIEVNVHPAKNWKELTDNTLTLYEEAKKSRLGTEKFMLDGKHTGTGGGNHVTLGGTTPADSPLLRNPQLLRSLLTFWQHHPGLSYLFSGAFIGPTSQAPRVDEARLENLYELEIAFSQIPEDKEVPFWLTDRLFRHLLTDITGNTHRAEFCIDKLYSPDSSSGRLGILELRAFDMPPHAQMSLMQMLLVRTLVSWFWKKPYKHELVRWGTELHDKFLLEHYVKEDIKDIVEQLNDAGYPFKLDWFDPFFEFRFPLYGMVEINSIQMELRMAIEPWNVLGEEMSGRGTARYVDSSLERVQVKLKNFTEERYTLTCNGVKVELSPTGTKGEYVAGVRFKAWEPWSALHPTIGVDTPLVFDIVDDWNKKSIGGCTYFVSHPGGRSYDTYPVNSYEAESRRINRFWDFGHTQGEVTPMEVTPSTNFTGRMVQPKVASNTFAYKEIPINPEYPHITDLRKK